MSPLELPWESVPLSFRFPKVYFYFDDSCKYCSQFSLRVPFVSVRLKDAS